MNGGIGLGLGQARSCWSEPRLVAWFFEGFDSVHPMGEFYGMMLMN